MLKEQQMNTLRPLVEKWLSLTATTPVRLSRFSCQASGQPRHVRIDAMRPEGAVAILFFRHPDGTWRVFPPETERLAMHVDRIAA
jgi:hypothetical protein